MTAAEQSAQLIYNKYFKPGATGIPFLTDVTVKAPLQDTPTGINPEYCATDELAADFLTLTVDMGFDASKFDGPPALEETIGEGQNYSTMVPWMSVNGFNLQNAAVTAHYNVGILGQKINSSINHSEANPRFGTVVAQLTEAIQEGLNSVTPAES
jgi:hypothetical protein